MRGMTTSDMVDHNGSPVSETLENKIKRLLISISAEEIQTIHVMQATTEKLKDISQLFSEQYEDNRSAAIATLIRQNLKIEQVLKNSIKKEMDFQLDIDKLLSLESAETISEQLDT
jgi:hypothetical protein